MTTVFHNGKVYTGRGGRASAFAVDNGVFLAAGSDGEILSRFKGAETHDLKGAFVSAGFIDSHMHLLNYGQVLSFAPLYAHTGSMDELLSCLRSFLKEHPALPGGWLRGRGWNQDNFTGEKVMPTRWQLDTVSEDIPICITRACGHCCVLNSKALELAHIDDRTPSPMGGSIGRTSGTVDGRLFDNAMDLLRGVIPLPNKDELKAMLRSACGELNRYGITSSQTDDYCVFRELPPETINEAYRELEAEGALSVRVYEQCNFTELSDLKAFIASGNVTGAGSDRFRIGPLKLLGDGALGSRTAHLSVPYPGTQGCGFSLFTPEHMKSMVAYAHSHGMQTAIHAIGDACLDEVLDAIEAALEECPRADHRHGVVHCQVSRPDQLERMIRLNVHVYAQSIFLDYDNHIVHKLLPPDIAASSYNWKTLLHGGLSVSNGSDCPVELPDVMRGVECAVTRRSIDGTGPYNPDQAFTLEEAIDSFTINGAEASFEEHEKGLIAEGFKADFVIWGADPFGTEPSKLHEIPVMATYLAGECVFDREGAIVENAKAFIKKLLGSEGSGHDHHHTFRVLNMAERLAKEEGAELFTVRLAALLHDADDVKLFPETNKNLDNARGFMRGQGMDEAGIEKVLGVIRQISFKGSDSVTPDSIEGKCVQDADRLDAIGAIGAARAFTFGGSRGRAMYDPDIPPKTDMNAEEYRKSDSTSLNHFYEKLFKLKDMMNTPSAKALAEGRDRFLHEFADEFLSEWSGER